jgi:hypothetical protein
VHLSHYEAVSSIDPNLAQRVLQRTRAPAAAATPDLLRGHE